MEKGKEGGGRGGDLCKNIFMETRCKKFTYRCRRSWFGHQLVLQKLEIMHLLPVFFGGRKSISTIQKRIHNRRG